MKKTTGILVLLLFSIVLAAGCGMMGGRGGGSSVSNLTQSGEWVYYTKDGTLYKMKPDWTGKTKLADNFSTQYMVIDAESIYYADKDMNLFSMKTDGTGSTKIMSSENMYGFEVSGGWIYYSMKPEGLYKIKTDGTEKTKVADISNFSGEMKVNGDGIYYVVDSSLYRMKTDGTESSKLADNAGLQAVTADWVYYGARTKEGKFVNFNRMKTDGTEKSKLADGAFAAIDGERIYYSKDDGLYRSGLDGTGQTKINDVNMWKLIGIWGDYIYYGVYEGNVYRINLDGSNKIELK